ncbi:hypothetical protein BAE44_0008478 [Dichanthelium oligosanthes]|uniref:Uncharacterized protein n=1 Tax=Dichanthelium oligosanthes TaxID=888268 RepID=A0A1E5VZD4_9POAL|nr:hypothetical protein BAE44_0008478 [Dichanthelium oligosanthes]
MGLRPSKRVDAALHRAPAFVAACYATFDRCLDDVQGAFGGVRRYQLADAASHLQASLRASVPLVRRWAPSPPARARVDPAARPGSGGGGAAAGEEQGRARRGWSSGGGGGASAAISPQRPGPPARPGPPGPAQPYLGGAAA